MHAALVSRKCSTLPPATLQRQYVDVCMQRPCYGSAQFRCHVERSSTTAGGLVERLKNKRRSTTIAVRLCISREFITLYEWREAASTETLLLVRPLLDCQWFTAPAIGNDKRRRVHEPINARDLALMPSVILHYADDTTPYVKETRNGTEIHRINEEASSCLLQLFTRQTPMVAALLDACVRSTEVELAQRVDEERLNNDDDDSVPLDEVLGRCVDDRLPVTSALHGHEHDERMARARLDGGGKCVHATRGSSIAKLVELAATADDVAKEETVVVFRETAT